MSLGVMAAILLSGTLWEGGCYTSTIEKPIGAVTLVSDEFPEEETHLWSLLTDVKVVGCHSRMNE